MAFSGYSEQQLEFEHLINFEEKLGLAETENLVSGIPEDQQSYSEFSNKGAFVHLVWNRMYRLGYLSTAKPKQNMLTSAEQNTLQKAVKTMQVEAGLTVDGWVGLQTWNSLQELFSFEHDSNLSFWSSPKAHRFLMRAVELRMAALGIFEKGRIRAKVPGRDLPAMLTAWRRLLLFLQADGIHAQSSDIEVIEWLFDIEKLTALAANKYQRLRKAFERIESLQNIEVFLASILKIELWLYGYEGIKPGRIEGTPDIKYRTYQRRRGGRGRRLSFNNKLSKVISEFAEDFAIDLNRSDTHWEIVSKCLQSIKELNEKDNSAENNKLARQHLVQQRVQELSQSIEEYEPEKRSRLIKAVQKIQHFTARIFDGIKRALKWVFDKISTLISWGKSVVRRIAMVVKQVASHSGSMVRRTFKILADGLRVLTDDLFPGSNRHIAMRHDKDFDFKIFVADTANSQIVTSFLNHFEQMMIRLSAAFVISTAILEAIYITVKAAVSGPISILFALIKIYKVINSIDAEIVQQAYAGLEKEA